MKPISLIVQAFGPYADVQVFDFRHLGSHTFFLIHGDTGSGKSTILDAICYALYGDSSGGERTGAQLRSHHAPLTRRTSVRFDFAIGCDRYRVARAPEHERPKQRGTGTTTDQQTAHLWLRNGCEDEDEPGAILAERWEQVNQRVIELLGFECDQFRQVVILPQGQFRDFLVAPSDQREAILSVLFKTDEFETIERALKDAANRIKREYDRQNQRLGDLYKQAEVTTIDALHQARDQRVIELEILKEHVETLRLMADDAQRRLQEGQEQQRKLNERVLAAQVLAALDARQTEVDAQRVECDDGRRAAALTDIETATSQRLAEARLADQECEQARQRYDQALPMCEQSWAARALAEQREPEIELARQQLAQLQSLAQGIGELEEAHTKLTDAEQQAQREAKQRIEVQGSLAVAETNLKSHEHRVAKNREIAAHEEPRQLQFAHMSRLHQARERLEVVSRLLAAAEQADHEAKMRYESAVAEYDEAQHHMEQVEHAWYAGQAGVLAQQLHPGAPCPVCGSTAHPLPALAAPDAPTEATLKHQRDTVRKQEKAQQDTLKALVEKQRVLTELRAEHLSLIEGLGNQHDVALDVFYESLKKATEDVAAAHAAQEALPQLEQALQAALTTVADLKERLTALDTIGALATTNMETARAIVAERERNIPDHLRTRKAIEQEITTVENRLRQLTTMLEQARKQAADAETEVASAEAGWNARVEAQNQAHQRSLEQERIFVERLSTQGFVDQEAYTRAKRTADALNILALQIRAYEQERAIAANRLAVAVNAVEGITTPDVAALTATAKQSRESYEDAIQRRAALGEQLTQYMDWCEDADQIAVALEQLQHQHQVMGEVARIANGENAYRMSFQRFVLAALLDEVLINASHRLQAMSRGRYTLQRALGQQNRRSAGGLELEVLDLFTGRARLAKTLSGGESFLASLALALGLADVVQARTGGIHLETMFVDEGFGSLDERALDQALQTLADLQSGGRLIGIISHITELQRRIAARLEVQASPSGSTARFVIGSG